MVTIADINGDGKPDLVFGGSSSSGGSVTVLLGKGDGTFQTGVTTAASSTDAPTGIVIVDENSDGKPDIVLGGATSPYYLPGNGDGTFTTAAAGYFILGVNSEHLKTADLTGLGLGDILLTSGQAIETFIAANSSSVAAGSFQLGLSSASGTASASTPATTTVTVTPQNGFASAVTLGCTGLPAGATCTFTPASVTPNGASGDIEPFHQRRRLRRRLIDCAWGPDRRQRYSCDVARIEATACRRLLVAGVRLGASDSPD